MPASLPPDDPAAMIPRFSGMFGYVEMPVSLRPDDPVAMMPWQSFLIHAAVGLGSVLLGPIVPVMLVIHWSCLTSDDCEASGMATSSGYFEVVVGTWACFSGLVAGILIIKCHGRLRHEIVGDADADAELGRPEDVDAEEKVTTQRSRSFEEVKRATKPFCLSVPFVVILAILPLAAYFPIFHWWSTVSSVYETCRGECEDALGSHLRCVCAESNIFPGIDASDCPRQLRDPAQDGQQLHELEVGATRKAIAVGAGHSDWDVCRSVLGQQNVSSYTESMLKHHRGYMAFESMLRKDMELSTTDIYGAYLGVANMVVLFGGMLALRSKNNNQAKVKVEFIRYNFLAKAKDYAKLFSYMYCLWLHTDYFDPDCPGTKPAHWNWTAMILYKLARETKNRSLTLDQLEISMADNDGDDSVVVGKKVRSTCQTEIVLTVLGSLVLACGFASITGIYRSLFYSGALVRWEGQDFFTQDGRIRELIIWNMVVVSVGQFLFIFNVVRAFTIMKHKLHQTLAFDCMWRFPEEDPLGTTFVNGGGLSLREARNRQKIMKFASCPSFDQAFPGGYRACFGREEDLEREADKLQEWFDMRRYLQVDRADECITMDLMLTVGLLMQLPKVSMIFWNVMVMTSGKGWKLEPVNFQALWDLLFYVVILLAALNVVLQFNDCYEQHTSKLTRFIHHVKVRNSRNSIAVRSATAASTPRALKDLSRSSFDDAAGDNGNTPDCDMSPGAASNVGTRVAQAQVEFMEHMLEAMGKLDDQLAIFGLQVNRRMITGLGSMAAVTMLPQAVIIFHNCFAGD